jgi:hypothetical protein
LVIKIDGHHTVTHDFLRYTFRDAISSRFKASRKIAARLASGRNHRTDVDRFFLISLANAKYCRAQNMAH